MSKTSIHIEPVKGGSEQHNKREKNLPHVRTELSKNNKYWEEDTQANVLEKIKKTVKEKTKRKLQAKATPIREAVVVINKDTTMKQLKRLAAVYEKEFGIHCIQIAIHKDEGHWKEKVWHPNYHAHMVFNWTDMKTGKSYKLSKDDMIRMQDLTAENLGMERGVSSDVQHLSSLQFKNQAEEQRLKSNQEQNKVEEERLQQTQLLNDSEKFDLEYNKQLNKAEEEKIKKILDEGKKIISQVERVKANYSKYKQEANNRKTQLDKEIKQKEQELKSKTMNIQNHLAIVKQFKGADMANAAQAMIEFSKSNEKEPTKAQKMAVNKYLASTLANNGDVENARMHREIEVGNIAISCINVCSKAELSKMDDALKAIANDYGRGVSLNSPLPDIPGMTIGTGIDRKSNILFVFAKLKNQTIAHKLVTDASDRKAFMHNKTITTEQLAAKYLNNDIRSRFNFPLLEEENKQTKKNTLKRS